MGYLIVRIFLTFAAAGLLSACVTDQNLAALRDAPGYPAGYGDGCQTANADQTSFSTKQIRDAYAFDNDESYRYGWRQGYLQCSNQIPEAETGGRILGERNEY